MKKWNLFFWIWLIFVGSVHTEEPVFAADVDEHIDTLEENIVDYLLAGYSADKVAGIFEKPYGDLDAMKELIAKIRNLLDELYSKNDIINIMVNNTESEEFFAQKNFWAKIKNRYFVLKLIASVVVAVGIAYLLYQYFYKKKDHWGLFNFPGIGSKNEIDNPLSETDDSAGKGERPPVSSNEQEPSQATEIPNEIDDKKKPESNDFHEKEQRQASGSANEINDVNNIGQPEQRLITGPENNQDDFHELSLLDPKILNALKGLGKKTSLRDRTLNEGLSRQIEQAKALGFEAAYLK